MIHKIGVFCGANTGNSILYQQDAEKLADVLTHAGITLVYGGANVGLMSIIANRMLSHGAKVIGVIPKFLADVEIAHTALTELHIVNSMDERKRLIAELSDGFMMLPGGYGSLDEFFEMLTLGQLSHHAKPCGILNIEGYYNHLLTFLDHAVSEGFLKSSLRHMIIVDQNPAALLHRFMDYKAPSDKKWINKSKKPLVIQ